MNPHIEQRGLFNARLLSGLGFVLFCIILLAYFFYGLQPVLSSNGAPTNSSGVTSAGDVVQFKVSKGEGIRDISAHLSQESLIKSIVVFKLYTIFTGKAQKLQPGIYELSKTMSVPDIVRALTQGGKNEVAVTIPEGSSLKDVESILRSAGIFDEKENFGTFAFKSQSILGRYPFLSEVNSLEGFLFPDTYRLSLDASVEDITETLLDNFSKKAWVLLQGDRSWYKTMTLASYLEREVPKFDDRRIVAGILLKRVALSIPLQVDSTIIYAKCGGAFRDCDVNGVTKADLSISSPFNTYKRLGFTPTPIANPGEAAIKAALNPLATQYLYYLSATKTQETYFSKTLDEHNTKRAKYL